MIQITTQLKNGRIIPLEAYLRSYRQAASRARTLSKGSTQPVMVEWLKKGQVEFAVLFENGKRKSDCALIG